MIIEMSLKDNFNQAVKEILKKDGFIGGNENPPQKEQKKKSELDKYLEPAPRVTKPVTPLADALLSEADENTSNPYVASPQNAQSFGRPVTPDPEPVSFNDTPAQSSQAGYTAPQSAPLYEQPTAAPQQNFNTNTNTQNFTSSSNAGAAQNNSGYNAAGNSNMGSGSFGGIGNMGSSVNNSGNIGRGGNVPPPAKPSSYTSNRNDTPYFETEETTVISRNTVIDGNIRSFANITIDGSVKGDVRITKNINISGKVVGDIECNNSVMNGASMQGNILSKGQVQVDRDSLLLGDIAAQFLDLNGKIKGNIECGGKAEFKTDAVILGNITASTITVLDGATIQGFVNTTFLQDTSSGVFPEAISVSD